MTTSQSSLPKFDVGSPAPTRPKSLRGFASMDPAKRRAIASKGGKAAHVKGTAHEYTADEASTAAKIGHSKGVAHEFTSEEARAAGRKGGLARAANRQKRFEALTSPRLPLAGEAGSTPEVK